MLQHTHSAPTRGRGLGRFSVESSLRYLALLLSFVVAFSSPVALAQTGRSSLVDRVGSTGFLQIEAESFNRLNDRQQFLSYYLSQAAIAIDPIIYDQMSRFGLRQKRILDAVVADPRGIRPESFKRILDFTKLFWANRGNHVDSTAQKFLPDFSPAELERAGLQAIRNGRLSMTPNELRRELTDLRRSFFDPTFEPTVTAKSPRGGLDILQASANNLYQNVSLRDLENFQERNPLNSRVVKESGRIVEQVYRAGTPDGSVPPGLYATYLRKANEFLAEAKKYAEPGQAEVIDALIRYYQTGEMRDWLKFGELWVQNGVTVDFMNGFVEVYRDARGVKGASEAYVTLTDERINRVMTTLADNAQYFEDNAPWDELYKKKGVKPPLARAVEAIIETGDMGVTTVGVNLPNEREVQEKFGTKSILLTGTTRAFSRAVGTTSLEEFAGSPEELRVGKAHGEEAEMLFTAMHEVIGHGSGKLNPRLTEGPAFYLKEYYSTLEEARADLMALYFITDPKLRELGLVSHPDVAKAMYYSAARVMLTQLRSIPKGDQIEEDHQRNRQLIAKYIMDKTGAIEIVNRRGKSYVVVKDFEKMREGVRALLRELMRIKGEGDYNAIKALIDKYAVRFDTRLRDQVVARYRRLNLPTYWAGVNPDLVAEKTPTGGILGIRIQYPRDFVRQRLSYAAMYEPKLLTVQKATTGVRR